MTRKQAWRRQDRTNKDGGGRSSFPDLQKLYTNDSGKDSNNDDANNVADIKNNKSNKGAYNSIFPLQYGALLKYVCDFTTGASAEQQPAKPALPKRKVGFDCSVKVVLIPSRMEFIQAGIAQDVWYNDEIDYSAFKRAACYELKSIMMDRNIFCHKEAMRILYQPNASDLEYPTLVPQCPAMKRMGGARFASSSSSRASPVVRLATISDTEPSPDEDDEEEEDGVEERPVSSDPRSSGSVKHFSTVKAGHSHDSASVKTCATVKMRYDRESGSDKSCGVNVGYDLDETQVAGIPATRNYLRDPTRPPPPPPPIPPPPHVDGDDATVTSTTTTKTENLMHIQPPDIDNDPTNSPVSVAKRLSPQPCIKSPTKEGTTSTSARRLEAAKAHSAHSTPSDPDLDPITVKPLHTLAILSLEMAP